jgi:hypothetical protein
MLLYGQFPFEKLYSINCKLTSSKISAPPETYYKNASVNWPSVMWNMFGRKSRFGSKYSYKWVFLKWIMILILTTLYTWSALKSSVRSGMCLNSGDRSRQNVQHKFTLSIIYRSNYYKILVVAIGRTGIKVLFSQFEFLLLTYAVLTPSQSLLFSHFIFHYGQCTIYYNLLENRRN